MMSSSTINYHLSTYYIACVERNKEEKKKTVFDTIVKHRYHCSGHKHMNIGPGVCRYCIIFIWIIVYRIFLASLIEQNNTNCKIYIAAFDYNITSIAVIKSLKPMSRLKGNWETTLINQFKWPPRRKRDFFAFALAGTHKIFNKILLFAKLFNKLEVFFFLWLLLLSVISRCLNRTDKNMFSFDRAWVPNLFFSHSFDLSRIHETTDKWFDYLYKCLQIVRWASASPFHSRSLSK